MIKQCILSLLCLLWAGQTVLAGELRERVYLQTDKQFYLSGELVWMKFIATDLDQRLSDVSKVGYVELLDSASAVVQARLVLEKGVGDGCLQLPSTLPTGNYRLVAYTRYMRNEGNIHTWSDIGVIFLLFALGLEFSFKKLMKEIGRASCRERV